MKEKLKFLEAFIPENLIPAYNGGILKEQREEFDKLKFEMFKPALEPLAKLVIKPILMDYLKTDPLEKYQTAEILLSGHAINEWVEIINDDALTDLWNQNETAKSMGGLKDLGFF